MVSSVALALLAVVGLACGGSTAQAPAGDAPSGTTIVIKDFAFSPVDLMVAPGATIRVENQDRATHTVTATDGSFDSGDIAGGQTGEITAPSTPGRYSYLCTPHPFMVNATIVVG